MTPYEFLFQTSLGPFVFFVLLMFAAILIAGVIDCFQDHKNQEDNND